MIEFKAPVYGSEEAFKELMDKIANLDVDYITVNYQRHTLELLGSIVTELREINKNLNWLGVK